jgi:ADP-ribose pyrophosphatase YjhB (NUDIX family)
MDSIIVGKDGKWYSSKNAKLDALGNVVAKHSYKKRYRATAVVIQNDKVMLVKDNMRELQWSMPGGGFKHKEESTIEACIREVTKEEIGGLRILSAERLRQCDFEGQRAKHKVAKLVVDGNAYVKDKHELKDEIYWWDMKSKIDAQGHVYYILNKLGKLSHTG